MFHIKPKAPVLLFLIAMAFGNLSAQVDAYFSSGKFNTPKNDPYIETYLTIVGKSLAAKSIDDKFQNSISIECKIFKDSMLIKAKKYNLLGPLFLSSAPSFIDNQRYALPNGTYEMQLTLSDNYDPLKKPLLIKAPLEIDFNRLEIQSSSIQPLESFKKALSKAPLLNVVMILFLIQLIITLKQIKSFRFILKLIMQILSWAKPNLSSIPITWN